jgi:hypothetical protein
MDGSGTKRTTAELDRRESSGDLLRSGAVHADATMQTLGAVQIGLMKEGAALEGNHYILNGTRIRVVYGQGQLLSDISKLYQQESTDYTSAEITICVGAKDDGGVPADVVRGKSSESTVVRAVSLSQWQTEEQAKHFWAGGDNVVTATH